MKMRAFDRLGGPTTDGSVKKPGAIRRIIGINE